MATVDLLADLPPATPEAVEAARLAAGLSQAEMAQRIGYGGKNRISEIEAGRSTMPPERWALLLLLIGQHPRYRITAA